MSLTHQLSDVVRFLNKHSINRVARAVARTSFGPFAVIRHVGRRSGKRYETPVIVIPAAGAFIIALTSGPEVDWYRNVLAAGGCKVLWHGREYAISEIEPVDVESARPMFSPAERLILGTLGTRHFVRLRYVMGGQDAGASSA